MKLQTCEKHNCEKQHNQVMVKGKLCDRWICKECKLEYDVGYRKKNREKRAQQQKEYYKTHKEPILENQKQYYQDNKEHILEQKKEYRQEHKDERKQYDRQYYQGHREERLNYVKQYGIENREEIKEYNEEYYRSNIEQLLESRRKHYQENKESELEYSRAYQKQRRTDDPTFKLRGNVSHSIRRELKVNGALKNGNSIIQCLPYSIQELKGHLEKQFEPWMNWQNWGRYDAETWNDDDQTTWKWNIDHITPHSAFSYYSMEDEEFRKCWALENLRPLSAKQNVIDGDRK